MGNRLSVGTSNTEISQDMRIEEAVQRSLSSQFDVIIPSSFSACFPHFNNRQVGIEQSIEGRFPTFGQAAVLLTADFTQPTLIVSLCYVSFGSFLLSLAG